MGGKAEGALDLQINGQVLKVIRKLGPFREKLPNEGRGYRRTLAFKKLIEERESGPRREMIRNEGRRQ